MSTTSDLLRFVKEPAILFGAALLLALLLRSEEHTSELQSH